MKVFEKKRKSFELSVSKVFKKKVKVVVSFFVLIVVCNDNVDECKNVLKLNRSCNIFSGVMDF